MKQKNRRQLLAAMAAMAILVPVGGVVQAIDADHILASSDTISQNNGSLNGESYWYGVVGGNAYMDTQTTGTLTNIGGLLTFLGKSDAAGLVNNVNSFIQDKTEEAGNASLTSTGGGLNLEGFSNDAVRYYGAIGGDLAINANFNQKGGADVNEVPSVSILHDGTINNIVDSGSVIGGVGGSAALGIGKVEVSASATFLGQPVTLTYDTDGEASTAIKGNVNTAIKANANVIGYMNGGLAAGLGGTAESTINGNSTLTIDGTGRTDNSSYEDPANDAVPPITTAINVMKGSGVNAIGVMGGGTAATTLGGTAASTVTGTSTVNIHNATVLGAVGGGAAASVDATGAAEALLDPSKQIGNDDGTSGFGIANGNSGLEIVTGPDEENATIKVNLKNVNQGGTATATTGDTYLHITGDSTVIGAVGGGLAAASHTYTYKGDGTVEGGNVNDAWGSSNETATTGRSHITVNLDSQLQTGNGWSEISSAVGGFINGIKTNTTQADSLAALDGKGGVFGIFGGGVAVGQGSLRATLSEEKGATAIANTAGADIDLESGYAAAVFGGGAAVTENLARAEANMTDDVNITTYSDMKTVGIFGGGLALSMEGEAGSDGYRAAAGETLAKSDVGTVNITNNGDTDGIFGGGMAIGNSNRNGGNAEYNDAVSSVQTSNITVNNGTVDNLNMEAFMSALKNGNTDGDTYPQWSVLGVNASGAMVDLKGVMDETSIAAGGLGMGMTGEATVEAANVTVNGGTVAKDILGGGIGIDNIGEKGGAHVGTSTITLNGGTVEGSVYAGGAVNGSTPGQVDKAYSSIGYDASKTSSTVGNATVTLNGTAVTGEISGQGYSKETQYTNNDFDPYNSGNSVTYSNKTLYGSVTGTSTLNISGTNTLSALDNSDKKYTSDSKIHDFTNVNVVADSTTILDGETVKAGGTALIDGGKVTVADSAKLDISELTKTADAYHIAANTATDSTFWSDEQFVYDRTEGFATGNTTTESDKTAYDVTYKDVASLTDEEKAQAANSMAGALHAGPLQPTIQDAYNKNWDTSKGLTAGGKQFFSDWSTDTTGAPYGRAAMIGEDAAVTGNTVSIARDMADNVMQRLSFTDDYVQDAGWVNNDGGIWAKYIHRKYETDGMGSSFGGIHSSTDYDGAIVGVDFQKSGKFQSGIAFHYGSGDGDGVISHNDYDAWGFTLYGSMKDEEAHTNLMADIGYVTSDNDIDGTVAGKHMSADRDVDAWTIGLRGEKEYVFGQNQLVPYVGLRYMSVNPARYSVYYDGQKAFNADADNQNLWLLPIGVSFRNETKTDAGWRITPKLDLSYIWAFGDTDTDMTIDMGGVGSGLYYDVMDDNSRLASLGVEASKDVWSFGVGYGYQKGDDTKNKTWYVNASYAF